MSTRSFTASVQSPPDTALRLSRALGTSDRFWINLQSRYDLETAVAKNHEALDQIRPLLSA